MIRTLILSLTWLIVNLSCLNAQEAGQETDLPLQLSISHGTQDALVIYVTGDGGWNSFNQHVVHEMEQKNYGVVALNSRKYFWSQKSPEQFVRDIELLSDYYLKSWNKSGVILVGYSFGADVVSFLPNGLSDEYQRKIRRVVLISPSASTDFVIRLSDLVAESENMNRRYQVRPEIEKSGLPLLCTFGKDEEKALKNGFDLKKKVTVTILPGDHRYNNDFGLLIKTIF